MSTKKIVFFALLFSIAVLPFAANAQGAQTLCGIVTALRNGLTGLGTALATIAFIVAGIMYLSAVGNPGNMSKGHGALIAAIVGIVVILLAPIAAAFIAALFGLNVGPAC